MPNRPVLERIPDDEPTAPLPGPEAYERGIWWIRQAGLAVNDAKRNEGTPEEPDLLTRSITATQIASAYFTAASAAVAAQSLIAGGLLGEQDAEAWDVVIGS